MGQEGGGLNCFAVELSIITCLLPAIAHGLFQIENQRK